MKTINKINSVRKLLRQRFIIGAVTILFLIAAALFYFILAEQQKPDPASQAIIFEETAKILNKDQNEITNEDFVKIKRLDLSGKEVHDIRVLRKFTNLEELNLNFIPLPEPDIPTWMVVLGKLRVINLYEKYRKSYTEKYLIDLSPLENLSHLKILYLRNTPLKDLKTLVKIKNLKVIHVYINQLIGCGALTAGVIPQDVYLDNRKFKLEYEPFPYNKNIQGPPDDSLGLSPTIIYYIPGVFTDPLQHTEQRIEDEVEKVLE